MNIQPSPEHTPSGQQVPQELGELQALGESLKALMPIPICYIDSHIALRVIVLPSNPPEVLQVAFEALNESREITTVFQSEGPIPRHLHGHILGIMKSGGTTHLSIDRQGTRGEMSPEEVLKLAERLPVGVRIPLMAKNIYDLLSKYAQTQWEVVACTLPSRCSGEVAVLQPVVPSLRQFIERPSIVTEQFSSQRVTPTEVERLNVTLNPDGGYAVMTVRTTSLDGDETQVESWKVLTPNDLAMNPETARTILLEQLGVIAHAFQVTGRVGIGEGLRNAEIDALPLPPERRERDYVDRWLRSAVDISNTASYAAPQHTMDSGAVAQLVFGTRYAMISLCAHEQHSKSGYRFVFDCSPQLSELNAPQIHHIRQIYALLTSEKSHEREEAVNVIANVVSKPKSHIASLHGETLGQFSLRVLTAESYTPLAFLSDLLEVTDVERFLAIEGISFELPEPLSASSIHTCLDGGRGIRVHLSQEAGVETRFDLFHHMKLTLLNDNSIRVFLKNKLGGEYRAVIPAAHQEEFLSSSDMVVTLCELFASQPADSWPALLEEIQRLEDGSTYDAELRAWDPRHDTIPLVTDRGACKMLEEAARVHAWIRLRGVTEELKSHITYPGDGQIELHVSAGEHSPSIVFTLQDGRMRGLTILRASEAVVRKGLQTNRFAHFKSDTLQVDSTEFQAIVDATASALQQVLQTSVEFRLLHDPTVPMRAVLVAAARYMSQIEKNYR